MAPPDRPPTHFENRVYDAIQQIPRGKVTTYRLLGQALQCNSAQAIGQALKRNPWAPEVPCHRVVKTDLTLGGYSGHTSGETWEKKRRLLEAEGVPIDEHGRLTDASCVVAP